MERFRSRKALAAAALLVAENVVVVAVVVLLLRPGQSSTATAPSASATATALPTESCVPPGGAVASSVTLRWFVGLGSGTQPDQIEAEKAFVTRYNRDHPCAMPIKLEIVPNTNAIDELKTEIASGNAPDIIGPVGIAGRHTFEGLFLDHTTWAGRFHTDLSEFEPAALDLLRQSDGGRLGGLPYSIYPGVIAYNKDLFAAAGLPEPPHRVGELYRGQEWTWDTLATVAKQLTVDKNARNAAETGFDPNNIVKYGLDFGYADARRMASCFAGGSLPVLRLGSWGNYYEAEIPPAWAHAWNWYHDAMWKYHFAVDGNALQSKLLLLGPDLNAFQSGAAAMETTWPWEIETFGTYGSRSSFKSWDLAVMPSYEGRTSSPLDMDTFSVLSSSKNPDEAYQAMLAIMADPGLRAVYGGLPARISERDAHFASLDASLAKVFPGNQVDWSVVNEMAGYAAVPSHESNMPNYQQSVEDLAVFYEKLRTDRNLDVTAELTKLQQRLTLDFTSYSSPTY
jgi:multiple sugar transport system substrate-binding protein